MPLILKPLYPESYLEQVYNHDQANFHKLQRGIEFDSGIVNASRCLNNTVSYNVLRNIGT